MPLRASNSEPHSKQVMKTLTHSSQSLPHLSINPLGCTALPFFFASAFLPSILQLAFPELPVAKSLAALSPAAAGFWLAAGLREHGLNFALVGVFLTILLWAVNWLMLDGQGCCSTM
ncbi:membrane hypothetical protein [Verrucomicrobia bacterium]|nr:membrane hypothetical protein [Verrucomicrobiota bacterium]